MLQTFSELGHIFFHLFIIILTHHPSPTKKTNKQKQQQKTVKTFYGLQRHM